MQLKEMFNEIEPELRKVDSFLMNCLEQTNDRLKKGYLHLLKAGGKRIRPAFTLLAARYGGADSEKVIPLASAFELFHMASLVHDDVIDNSRLRRGEPTIRTVFGNDFSLHLGDCLFAKALQIVEECGNAGVSELLAYTSMEMCRGELEQIAAAYDYNQNIRQYFYRIKRKTSLLITLSCQAGAIAANADPQVVKVLGRYGHNIGMAFQITDDVLDYIADEKALGKPVGSDIQQGVVTLPLIYILNRGSEMDRSRLLAILYNKSFTREDICNIAEIIETGGALSFSLRIANKYVEKALQQLELLPENKTTGALREVAKFIYHRQY